MTGKEKEAKKIIREMDMEETLEAAQLKRDEVSLGFLDAVLETTCLLMNNELLSYLQIENYKSVFINDLNQLIQTLQSLKKENVVDILLKVRYIIIN